MMILGSTMILANESIVLCTLFTLMVYIMSRNPIKTLYNYPPKIQERVMSLDDYKDQIPTQKNKVVAQGGIITFICADPCIDFEVYQWIYNIFAGIWIWFFALDYRKCV